MAFYAYLRVSLELHVPVQECGRGETCDVNDITGTKVPMKNAAECLCAHGFVLIYKKHIQFTLAVISSSIA